MSTTFTPNGLVHHHSKDCSHSIDDAEPTTLRERLRKVLIENAVTGTENQGLHGWRCQYPDSYGGGPCNCVDLLLDDLEAAI